jgi:hypothetical protein
MAKIPFDVTKPAPPQPEHPLAEEQVYVHVPPSQQNAQYPVSKPGEPLANPTPGILDPNLGDPDRPGAAPLGVIRAVKGKLRKS